MAHLRRQPDSARFAIFTSRTLALVGRPASLLHGLLLLSSQRVNKHFAFFTSQSPTLCGMARQIQRGPTDLALLDRDLAYKACQLQPCRAVCQPPTQSTIRAGLFDFCPSTMVAVAPRPQGV